jgi:hypothetical protein
VKGALAGLFTLSFVLAACSRTGLHPGTEPSDGGADANVSPPCEEDTDCPRDDLCVLAFCDEPAGEDAGRRCRTEPVNCNDGDACSLDRCEPADGRCVHERAADNDRDMSLGEAPPGLPANCGGPDCDDDDPLVFPGARELCDSKDNDCDGSIDDGSLYTAPAAPVLLAPSVARSENGRLAFDGSSYGVVFTELSPEFRGAGHFQRIAADGRVIAGPVRISEINAESVSGSIAYSGTSFLTAWSDARQAGNYEVYATRYDRDANKLQPDLRLTNASDFSIQPTLRHTGEEYVLLWADHRDKDAGGGSAVYGRRLSGSGEPLSEEVRLTDSDEDAESASFDVGERRLGMAYVVAGEPPPGSSEASTTVRFRTFDRTLGDPGKRMDLGTNAQQPTVRLVGSRFVVAWHTGSLKQGWGAAIPAATLDEDGTLLASREITSGDAHAKHRSLVSLGDRVLVVWAAEPPELEQFQLFYETVSRDTLDILTPRQLLMKSATGGDLISPQAVRGPDGDVAITYDEIAGMSTNRAFFLRLACAIP